MRGQSSLLNKSPNIRLQSFLTFIQKALDMNWESIYKDDGGYFNCRNCRIQDRVDQAKSGMILPLRFLLI